MSVRERARRLFGGRQQTQAHAPVQFPSVHEHEYSDSSGLGALAPSTNAANAARNRPTRPSRPESFHMLDTYDDARSVGSKASMVARHGPVDSAIVPLGNSGFKYGNNHSRIDEEAFYQKSSISNDGHTDLDGFMGNLVATGNASVSFLFSFSVLSLLTNRDLY